MIRFKSLEFLRDFARSKAQTTTSTIIITGTRSGRYDYVFTCFRRVRDAVYNILSLLKYTILSRRHFPQERKQRHAFSSCFRRTFTTPYFPVVSPPLPTVPYQPNFHLPPFVAPECIYISRRQRPIPSADFPYDFIG